MLHRCFAIFFLAVYTLVLFQPLVPWIEYSVNKDYIAKNLCENRKKPGSRCNGKCYLAKELNKAGKGIPSNAPSSQKNSVSEEVIVHLGNSFSHCFQMWDATNTFVQYSQHYKLFAFGDGVERPPCA